MSQPHSSAGPITAAIVIVLFMAGSYYGSYITLATQPGWIGPHRATYRVPANFPTEVFWLAEQFDQKARP